MVESDRTNPKRYLLERYSWALAASWAVIVLGSLAWNMANEKANVIEHALIQARTVIEENAMYRRWNAGHGGVYALVDVQDQPDEPVADVPDRELTATSGKRYALINPAYMVRQVSEMTRAQGPIQLRITSLKALRPENQPDSWEMSGLLAFEQGEKEVISEDYAEGRGQLRLMRPFKVDSSCLQCHREQGYRAGDVRGGISVTAPLAPFKSVEHRNTAAKAAIHAVFLALGLAGIGFAGRGLRQREKVLTDVQKTLSEKESYFRSVLFSMQEDILVVDGDFRINDANKDRLATFACSRDEIIGRSCY